MEEKIIIKMKKLLEVMVEITVILEVIVCSNYKMTDP